ncbi:LemA family protein [Chachezhania antarctica]|uniref:LemA family protein n=1 Tax=Chachezhania antarctica TaxID=2340860 RepID=UPI000EB1BFD0|nr:LemA family protein [Chachezhania antarctica]|tara:strand:+ start:627 stop:1175 length:549 start_codon:yes stop_codon:yes gene_type:complete
MGLWIATAALVVLALYTIWLFRRLVTYRRQVGVAWSDISAQIKRRHHLVPGLIEAVQGSEAARPTALDGVVHARDAALSSTGSQAEKARAEARLGDALVIALTLSEDLADLRTTERFNAVRHELDDTARRIRLARRYYNLCVRRLNAAIESFPTNLLARLLHVRQEAVFSFDIDGAAARSAH